MFVIILGEVTDRQDVSTNGLERLIKRHRRSMETGAVKSRSEAAAVFIREGLKVRDSELDGLRDALNKVQEAKTRLHREAREVFGMEPDQTPDNPDPSESSEDCWHEDQE